MIKVEKYDPIWNLNYTKKVASIQRFFKIKNISAKFEHIGGTSVNGLAARPIIDILVALDSDCNVNHCIDVLMNKSYKYDNRNSDKHKQVHKFYKTKPINPLMSRGNRIINNEQDYPESRLFNHIHHIYLVPANSQYHYSFIRLKTFFRNNNYEKNRYSNFKLHLSTLKWASDLEYESAKHNFFMEIKEKYKLI